MYIAFLDEHTDHGVINSVNIQQSPKRRAKESSLSSNLDFYQQLLFQPLCCGILAVLYLIQMYAAIDFSAGLY